MFMDFLSKWLQNLLIPVLYVVFMHQPPQVRKSHAKFSLISLPGKGASHANRYLEVPTTSPVCSLLICSSIVFNSPGIGGKEDTGKQVQLRIGLRPWARWNIYSSWGAPLLLLVKCLARMLAFVGGACDQELWKWIAEVLILVLSLCVASWHLTSLHLAEQKQAEAAAR